MSIERIAGALLMFFILGGVGWAFGGTVIGFGAGVAGLVIGLSVAPSSKPKEPKEPKEPKDGA